MKEHIIDLPKKIVVGEGVISKTPEYLRELGVGNRILLITGPKVFSIIGKNVMEMLREAKFDVIYKIIKDAHINTINNIIEEFRNEKTKVPLAIIADSSVIAKAPYRLLASGVGDVIAKFTAVLDWRLAHKLKNEYYGEYAASLALLSAKHVLCYANVIRRGDEKAVRIVMEALISSSIAMCIAGSTRPGSGSEHLFSHALDLIAPKPALHGEQCGVGTIMMAYLHGKDWRKIRRTLKRIGAPTTAKELGIPDYYIIKALTIAHKIRPERYTILGETGLTWEAAENLARTTGVID